MVILETRMGEETLLRPRRGLLGSLGHEPYSLGCMPQMEAARCSGLSMIIPTTNSLASDSDFGNVRCPGRQRPRLQLLTPVPSRRG